MECLAEHDQDKMDLLFAVTVTSSTLSICGAILVFVLYFSLPETRNHSTKLVLFLSLADLFAAVFYLVSWHSRPNNDDDSDNDSSEVTEHCINTTLCRISGALMHYFELSTFFWSVFLAINGNLVIARGKWRAAKRIEKWYHVVGWGCPLIPVIVVATIDGYGDSGGWCWIQSGFPLSRFLSFFLPMLVATVLVCGIHAQTHRSISKMFGQTEEIMTTKYISCQILQYVLAFVLTRIPGLVNRTHNYFAQQGSLPLAVLHAAASPLQGFVNALVYGAVARKLILCRARGLLPNHDAAEGHQELVETKNRSDVLS